MAISNVSSASAAIAATQMQGLDAVRKTEEKKPVQPAELRPVENKPVEARKPASTATLGSVINTTA